MTDTMTLEEKTDRYGQKWGPFFWRANVTVAGQFFAQSGWEIRWIGIAVPFTNWGLGLLFKRRIAPIVPGDTDV